MLLLVFLLFVVMDLFSKSISAICSESMLGNESDRKKAAAERDYLQQEMNSVTVNITNSNGSVSQVKLQKYGVGYIGTRGEYYRTMPTEEHLRVVYGF